MNMHTFVTLTEEEVDKDDRVTNNGMSWNIRKRFVELDLVKNMFCCMCNVPLHLQYTVSERVWGGGGGGGDRGKESPMHWVLQP